MTQALTVKENCIKVESALMKDDGKALMEWLDQDKDMCARYIACTKAMIRKSKRLGECTVASICTAVLAAAQCGLLPDGQMGALVPYNNKIPGTNKYQMEAVFQPMVRGLVELVYASSDKVQKIWGHIVYEKDEFEYSLGLKENLHHDPATGARGNPIGCYMYVLAVGEVSFFNYMSKEEIELHGQTFSKAYEDKYAKFWKHPINRFAMWKKTVFRQMWTWIPKGLIQGPSSDPAQAKAAKRLKATEEVEFEILTDEPSEEESNAVEVKVEVVNNSETEPPPPDEHASEPKKEAPPKTKPAAKAKAAAKPKAASAPPKEDTERTDLLEMLGEYIGKLGLDSNTLPSLISEACTFAEPGTSRLEDLDTDSLRQLREHLKNG